MRISKKVIGFGIKLSKDFQSVDVSESIELEFKPEEKIDYEAIDVMSTELRSRVLKMAKAKLEEVVVQRKPANKDLEDNNGRVEDIELVM